MSNKNLITERDVRLLIRAEIVKTTLINERRVLNEFMAALTAALPTLAAEFGPALAGLAARAPALGSIGARTTAAAGSLAGLAKGADWAGMGATALDYGKTAMDYSKTASDVAGAASRGVQGFSNTAQSFTDLGHDVRHAGRQYDQARSQVSGLTDSLFGSKESSDQVQQAMNSMGPDLNQLGDEGIQSVFGKDNPQQMLDISQMINQGNLADAALLYGAMKGLGTDDKVVRDVMQRRQASLPNLAQEFAVFTTSKGEKDNNIASWLKDDGMRKEAELFGFMVQDTDQ